MNQSNPTVTRWYLSNKVGYFLFIVPFLLLPSIIFFAIGKIKWGILALGLLPLVFLSFLLSRRLTPPRLREIYDHMTASERGQFDAMATSHGLNLIVGLFAGTIYPILHSVLNVTHYAYYVGVFLLFLLVAVYLAHRQRNKMIRFALTTQYAKEKGWDAI